MTRHLLFPFIYSKWEQDDHGVVFTGIEWQQKWGPFDSGDRIHMLCLDYLNRELTEYGPTGFLISRTRFKVVPDQT